MIKSFFDRVLALFLILLFLPVYILVAILIVLKMGTPILFRQQRPGYKAKVFDSIFRQFIDHFVRKTDEEISAITGDLYPEMVGFVQELTLSSPG